MLAQGDGRQRASSLCSALDINSFCARAAASQPVSGSPWHRGPHWHLDGRLVEVPHVGGGLPRLLPKHHRLRAAGWGRAAQAQGQAVGMRLLSCLLEACQWHLRCGMAGTAAGANAARQVRAPHQLSMCGERAGARPSRHPARQVISQGGGQPSTPAMQPCRPAGMPKLAHLMQRKASITTLPLTDCMGSTTTAAAGGRHVWPRKRPGGHQQVWQHEAA